MNTASVPDPQPHGADPLVQACLSTLRALGPSIDVRFVEHPKREDRRLHLQLGRHGQRETFLVQTTRTHLSYALASGLIERARAAKAPWLLFAPYVPAKIGHHLEAHDLSYADAVGNCHLQSAARDLLAHVEGKRPVRDTTRQAGGRVPSYQLVFAILAEPALLDAPGRQTAVAAGIGKTAAADQLKRLNDQGLIRKTRSGASIIRRRDLLDRWLSAYADIVRPSWLVGRYRMQANEPEAIEQQLASTWRDDPWAFGGGAAAWRMNQFYRGTDTVIHVHAMPTDALRRLRAIPAQDGALTILRTPGTLAYAGTQPHLAHPLLIYTEMITSADPRMREAADEIRKQFLAEQT